MAFVRVSVFLHYSISTVCKILLGLGVLHCPGSLWRNVVVLLLFKLLNSSELMSGCFIYTYCILQ